MEELIQNGASILLVSHNLRTIEQYCSRAICLENGQIIKHGNSKEVAESYLKFIENLKLSKT